MAFGNKVIATEKTGAASFINELNGWKTRAVEEPVIVNNPPMNNIYNARETWMEPTTASMRKNMRKAFEEGRDTFKNCLLSVAKFSYDNVAKAMEKVL